MQLHAAYHFTKPYRDCKPNEDKSIMKRVINGKCYTIYRGNHGLCHSLRQGFLAKDVVLMLKNFDNNVKCLYESYPNFMMKIAILSSFQRSGRESEVSSSQNKELYLKYERKDQINFVNDGGNLFSKSERELWSEALIWDDDRKSFDNSQKKSFLETITKIIKVAHLLDLRRVVKFDKSRIKDEIVELLGNDDGFDWLWERSGKYLKVTGDRDMVTNKNHYSDRFFILQNNPPELFERLRKAHLGN